MQAVLEFHLTLPLEAGTIKWGFQRGRASPLVASGVQTPFVNSIDLNILARAAVTLGWQPPKPALTTKQRKVE